MASDTSMLLMLHTGRRSSRRGLFRSHHECARQLCKRHSTVPPSGGAQLHFTVADQGVMEEHRESPRWSECVESHIKKSLESVHTIHLLPTTGQAHVAQAHRASARPLCAQCGQTKRGNPVING